MFSIGEYVVCTWNWVQRFLNLKKRDRTKTEGFIFWKNLSQTCTQRMAAKILKCPKWTGDSPQKGRIWQHRFKPHDGNQNPQAWIRTPMLGVGLWNCNLLMESTQVNGTFFEAMGTVKVWPLYLFHLWAMAYSFLLGFPVAYLYQLYSQSY